jgi:hypothetical protein
VFPYTTLPHIPPRPYLSIVLRNGCHTSPIVVALVDSGADRPIFPMEMAADFLQLDLSQAESWPFRGLGNVLQQSKLAEVRLAVLTEDDTTRAFEVTAVCAFCDTFGFPATGGVLGQNGFFSRFRTTFHQPYKYFEIEPWPAPRILGTIAG